MSKTPRVDPLLVQQEGHAEPLIGNEAIVRGALEAGVAFACGYPGTPSSEVTDSFARVSKKVGITFEYSVNEKVALEMAFAASLAGARSICAMKHLGLMYAGDPLSTMPYVGTTAGMVIVSAGDPTCRTSPNEQDQRHLASMLFTPMLDPPTPAAAHAMTRFAFELSEQCQLPVIMRPTTRVCHSRGVVHYGKLQAPRVTGFVRDPKRLVPIPVNARRLRLEIDKRLEKATKLLADTDFIQRSGQGKTGIIAAGAPAAVCADVLRDQGLSDQVCLLSVGVVYPLLEQRFIDFLKEMDRVLVLEELTPYLEDALLALCNRQGIRTPIMGKRSGHLPGPFEYEPHVIRQGLSAALGLGSPLEALPPPEVPPRPPILCPGCPHRSAYFAARAAFDEDQLYFNDIGCYTLGYGPPLDTADALLCMGAGISLAAGVSRVSGERTVGFIGDSTFFHSGLPPLLNAIKENVSMVAVILDNSVTAMTGFQESPTVEIENDQAVRQLSIESVVRGLGCQHIERVNAFELPRMAAAFCRAKEAEGVSVVIVERSCPTFMLRETGKREWITRPYVIDHDRCQTCGRNPCGMQCSVALTSEYQRHMARARAMEQSRTEPVAPVAPCSTQCPLFLCIQGYVGHIAAGEYREALEHIVSRNPLAETVCRVCDRPCEPVCVRRSLDEPVAINDLKRFVVDWAAKQETYPYAPDRDEDHDKKVAIVGAGPSGLAAAHDLRLRGFQVTLLDANSQPGGLLLTGIPPFRLPRQALKRDVDRILALGVEFRGNQVLGKDFTLQDLLDQGYDAIYLAIGAHQGIRMGLDGENGSGSPIVVDALAYLKGVHLDGDMETSKRVVVVGGGNAAIDAARTARRQGAQQVTIAYRRRRSEMPAIPEEVEAAEQEGIELRTQLQPLSIFRGNKPGLECIRTEPGEPDASGRQRPVPVGGSEMLLEAEMIIAAIGQAPEPAAFGDRDLDLELCSNGAVEVDPQTGQTSHLRIFAGGDLTEARHRTVTWAMACGQRAAWAIDRSLRGPEQADRRPPPPRPGPARDGQWPGIEREDRAERQHPGELSPSSRASSYAEVVAPLTEQQARAEAARCLVCGLCGNCRSCIDLFGCPAFYVADGRVQIDPAICTGCGVCAAFCPNNAISPKQEPQP